jgi:hypothetical protein
MPKAFAYSLFIGVTAAASWSQPAPENSVTITLANVESAGEIQSLVTAVRTAGRVQTVSLDASKRTAVFVGSAAQIQLVKRLAFELDQSSTKPLGDNTPAGRIRVEDGSGDAAQVLYLAHAPHPQAQQEIMSAIRTVVDLPAIFPHWPRRALVTRGTPAQLDAAMWLIDLLDQPGSGEGIRLHQMPDGESVAVFFQKLTTAHQLAEMQKAVIKGKRIANPIFP